MKRKVGLVTDSLTILCLHCYFRFFIPSNINLGNLYVVCKRWAKIYLILALQPQICSLIGMYLNMT
jgi:hypothetical protein